MLQEDSWVWAWRWYIEALQKPLGDDDQDLIEQMRRSTVVMSLTCRSHEDAYDFGAKESSELGIGIKVLRVDGKSIPTERRLQLIIQL